MDTNRITQFHDEVLASVSGEQVAAAMSMLHDIGMGKVEGAEGADVHALCAWLDLVFELDEECNELEPWQR